MLQELWPILPPDPSRWTARQQKYRKIRQGKLSIAQQSGNPTLGVPDIYSLSVARNARQQPQLRPQRSDVDPHRPCGCLGQALVAPPFDAQGCKPGRDQERRGVVCYFSHPQSPDRLFDPGYSGFEPVCISVVAPRVHASLPSPAQPTPSTMPPGRTLPVRGACLRRVRRMEALPAPTGSVAREYRAKDLKSCFGPAPLRWPTLLAVGARAPRASRANTVLFRFSQPVREVPCSV
jgi:hypothetical protein